MTQAASKAAERANKVLANLLSIISKTHVCRRRVSNDWRKVYIALLSQMSQQITLRNYRLFCLASVHGKIRVRPPGRHAGHKEAKKILGTVQHRFAKDKSCMTSLIVRMARH